MDRRQSSGTLAPFTPRDVEPAAVDQAQRPHQAGPTVAARSELIHEIFEAQADARPNEVAVLAGRRESTYSDLERRANRLARHLRDRGIGRGSIVGLLLPRSIDAYAAL